MSSFLFFSTPFDDIHRSPVSVLHLFLFFQLIFSFVFYELALPHACQLWRVVSESSLFQGTNYIPVRTRSAPIVTTVSDLDWLHKYGFHASIVNWKQYCARHDCEVYVWMPFGMHKVEEGKRNIPFFFEKVFFCVYNTAS